LNIGVGEVAGEEDTAIFWILLLESVPGVVTDASTQLGAGLVSADEDTAIFWILLTVSVPGGGALARDPNASISSGTVRPEGRG
jgi:hypothetical protein